MMSCNVFPLNKRLMFLLSQWNSLYLGLEQLTWARERGRPSKTTGLTCNSSHIKHTTLLTLTCSAAKLNKNTS